MNYFTHYNYMFGLFAVLIPLMNTEGTCTLDAYIHCKLWENKEIVQELDYIDPVTQYRDRIRDKFKESGNPQHVQGLLTRLDNIGIIKSFEEIPPRGKPQVPFILEVRNAERDDKNVWKGNNEYTHAMCAIGETETQRIVFNDRGTERGYGGFGFVEKGNHIYHDFE